MTDDNNFSGRSYTLDSTKWTLLNIDRKTDPVRGRIQVGIKHLEKTIAVFVADIDTELEMCDKYYLLPRTVYTEIRKTRKKAKEGDPGDPLKIQKNGDVWTTCPDKYVKIFVKEDDDDGNDQ